MAFPGTMTSTKRAEEQKKEFFSSCIGMSISACAMIQMGSQEFGFFIVLELVKGACKKRQTYFERYVRGHTHFGTVSPLIHLNNYT